MVGEHPRKIVIVETASTGHRLDYVRRLALRAEVEGDKVILAVSDAVLESAEFATFDLQQFQHVTVPDKSAASLRRIDALLEPGLIVVPDGDRVAMKLSTAGWRGLSHLVLLVMRDPAMVRSWKSPLRRLALSISDRRSNVSIHRLAGPVRNSSHSEKIVNDPASFSASPDQTEQLRAGLESCGATYWFAVVGAITGRKNIALIAEALAESEIPGTGLLVAGRVNESASGDIERAKEVLANTSVSFALKPGLMDSTTFDSLLAAVDCLLVVHSNDQPSGVLAKAYLARTNVIAAGAPSLRGDVEKLSWGSWCRADRSELSRAFQDAVKTRNGYTDVSTSLQDEFEWRLLKLAPPSR